MKFIEIYEFDTAPQFTHPAPLHPTEPLQALQIPEFSQTWQWHLGRLETLQVS